MKKEPGKAIKGLEVTACSENELVNGLKSFYVANNEIEERINIGAVLSVTHGASNRK